MMLKKLNMFCTIVQTMTQPLQMHTCLKCVHNRDDISYLHILNFHFNRTKKLKHKAKSL